MRAIGARSIGDPSRGIRRGVASILAFGLVVPVSLLGPPTASAAILAADYQFQNSLGSSTGAVPVLSRIGPGSSVFNTEPVGGTSRTVLSFPTGSGLALAPASEVIPADDYTIVLLFRFSQTDGWRKLVDFKNATADEGLYNLSGRLNFYPTRIGPLVGIRPDGWTQVVLTRDDPGNVVGYLNGIRQFSFMDEDELAVIDDSDTLRFFRDDDATAGEHSAGAVARIRLFAGALTDQEVGALACEEVPAVICGTDGVDALIGTPDDDVVLALGGADTVEGLEGDDLLSGGSGADTLVGGDGDDLALGGLGSDTLEGGGGIDVLHGGDGADRLTGGGDPDALIGGRGRDLCHGRPNRDFFRGCEAR